ncbi:MAG: ThuA domain-containing protein [Oscillospiraceae bacterium]|nr:ThuA domain-containing protein [Oscillospiraceae bacterium]
MKKINILIYTEDVLKDAALRGNELTPKAYPNGLHAGIAGAFDSEKYNVRAAGIDNIRETITPEILADTDVLFWWGHCHHHEVPDDIAELVVREVNKGMGFVALHSAHIAKPFLRLIGTSGSLSWRLNDSEIVWTAAPYHPIAAGIPTHFKLPNEEIYSEPFDIPAPEDTVFIGWFSQGMVFRSGVTYRRGYGKVFYFQPGHEEYPIYYDETIRQILSNAAGWAAPQARRDNLNCPNVEPVV